MYTVRNGSAHFDMFTLTTFDHENYVSEVRKQKHFRPCKNHHHSYIK